MASIIYETIGISGRDYATINEWNAATSGLNLVSLDEIHIGVCYNDSPFIENNILVLSGATTDVDHYRKLTTAIGHGHFGNITTGVNLDGRLIITEPYFQLDGLRIHGSNIYNTGTVTVSGGTVTLSGGIFPTYFGRGDNIIIDISGTPETKMIWTRDSNTQITLYTGYPGYVISATPKTNVAYELYHYAATAIYCPGATSSKYITIKNCIIHDWTCVDKNGWDGDDEPHGNLYGINIIQNGGCKVFNNLVVNLLKINADSDYGSMGGIIISNSVGDNYVYNNTVLNIECTANFMKASGGIGVYSDNLYTHVKNNISIVRHYVYDQSSIPNATVEDYSFDFSRPSVTLPTNFTAKDSDRKWRGIAMSETGLMQMAVAEDSSDGDYIYKSNNAGSTWTSAGSSEKRRYTFCAMSKNGKYRTAVAQDSLSGSDSIYRSDDYGETWNAVSNTSGTWFKVAVCSSGDCQLAAEVDGYLHKSTDYGQTWSQVGISGEWRGLAIAGNSSICIAGEKESPDGYLYISTDMGDTWTKITSGGDAPIGNFQRISISYTGQYILAAARWGGSGSGGYIYTSDDYGATWTKRLTSPDITRKWESTCMSSNGQYQFAAEEYTSPTSGTGQIWSSTDYGVTWVSYSGTDRIWQGMACSISADVVAAIVYVGKIYIKGTTTLYGDSGYNCERGGGYLQSNFMPGDSPNHSISGADPFSVFVFPRHSSNYGNGFYGFAWQAKGIDTFGNPTSYDEKFIDTQIYQVAPGESGKISFKNMYVFEWVGGYEYIGTTSAGNVKLYEENGVSANDGTPTRTLSGTFSYNRNSSSFVLVSGNAELSAAIEMDTNGLIKFKEDYIPIDWTTLPIDPSLSGGNYYKHALYNLISASDAYPSGGLIISGVNCIGSIYNNSFLYSITDRVLSTSLDAHLKTGSVCIGAGIDLSGEFSELNTDIAGVTREAVWDIGAYKYIASSLRNLFREIYYYRNITIGS